MKLNDNWRLNYDENNVILEFHEKRIRKGKDDVETEYEFVDPHYYPTVPTALKGFLHKNLKGSESVQELVRRIEQTEKIITNLKFK